MNNVFRGLFLAGGLALLTACNSSEERAEKHFQTALEHIESGDLQRATVEFRNVFKYNSSHRDARLAYAQMLRASGDATKAYGQYLRLVEQYPNDVEGRIALAEMALDQRNWEEFERHGRAAANIAPQDPRVRAIVAGLDYQEASKARDPAAQSAAAEQAEALIASNPELITPYRVVIDNLIHEKDWDGARKVLDAALTIAPDRKDFYTQRLLVLTAQKDDAAILEQLESMEERFAGDEAVRDARLRWHISRGETDAAEAYLRGLIDPSSDATAARVRLVQFLVSMRGPDAALAELDRIISGDNGGAMVFRIIKAGLIFERGDHEAAIAELQDLLQDAEPSRETDSAKVSLAKMLTTQGRVEEARTLVDAVLTNDPSNVGAIKLRAGWQIEADETGQAISSLREALGDSPQDPELMMLLAQAHERDGNNDLMADMLSLAVEASENAPSESLRYAKYLMSVDNSVAAEKVLLDALRKQPDNGEILNALGYIYLGQADWRRLDDVIRTLQRLQDPGAGAFATGLTAQKLAAQERDDELGTFLEDVADADKNAVWAVAATVRGYLGRDDTQGAMDYVDAALERNPDNPALLFVRASTLVAVDRLDEAEAAFRSLLDSTPQSERTWMALYQMRQMRGQTDAADAILDEALTSLPDSSKLRMLRAEQAERDGRFEDAIALYGELYEEDSNSVIVANNLASLLANHRDDAESLERAYRLSLRLRIREVPAFQDTYGWVSYLRGEYEEALDHLKPAADGLPDDPAVQYHLAMAYAALGHTAEALAQLQKVVAMVPDDARPAFMDKVDSEIIRLSTVPKVSPEAGD